MRPCALMLTVALLWPAAVPGQQLPGSYRYDGPDGGSAVLTLQQDSPTRVTGRMEMSNGMTFGIEGQVENGRALGDITFDGGRGFFAAGFQGSTLLVVVAERNPENGQPMLDAGWSLEFQRVGGASSGAAPAGPGMSPAPAGAPATGTPGVGAPGTGAPGMGAPAMGGGGFAQTDHSPTAQAWLQKLRGRKVTYLSSYSSGQSGGMSTQWHAYLCSDGRFVYRTSSSMSVDVGGVFGGSNSRDDMAGVWRIVTQGQQAAIEYRSDDGRSDYVLLDFRDGKTFWDGQRVFVTNENDVCR